MTVVQGTALDSGKSPIAHAQIRISLVTSSPTMPGYSSSGELIGPHTLTADANGVWSIDLTPNTQITPANTYYRVQEASGTSYIVVPPSGGPCQISTILQSPPPTPSPLGITGVQVATGGTVAGSRPAVNFVAGAGVTIGALDNPGQNRVDVTVSASGSNPAAVNGLLGWNFDPVSASANTQLNAGKIYLLELAVPSALTITNLVAYLNNAGSGLSAGQNFAGLYNAAGNQVGVTADLSGAWASGGNKAMPLTAPYAAAAGIYYVALLANGTTPPSLIAASPSGQAANAGLSGAPWRFASKSGAATVLPASLTPGVGFGQEFPLWIGVS